MIMSLLNRSHKMGDFCNSDVLVFVCASPEMRTDGSSGLSCCHLDYSDLF